MSGKFLNNEMLLIFILLLSCQSDDQSLPNQEAFKNILIPSGFPNITYPDGNTFTLERWNLGKKLFYDSRLSIDSSISCASCHHQEYGFADKLALTPGVLSRPATRNAPSLANVAYHPYYTREGGVPTLEMQILIPIAEHNEFDFNMVKLVNRLGKDSLYQSMAKEAYGRSLDAYSITRAISTFERSLVSGDSKYDQFMEGKSTFTTLENQGMALFYSERTQCSMCHSGFNFTNYAFENNGLYDTYSDVGRMRLTNKVEDLARFKVPSLRLVGVTAPYMHDGSMLTLTEVVEHYNQGGKNHSSKSTLIKKLNLSQEEKSALVAFLHTLTDDAFLSNRHFGQ